jgi:opacity protein-like surface antigen
LYCAATAALLSPGGAHAAEPFNWNGFYAGLVAGASSGQYGAQTSTVSAGYLSGANLAAVNAAGAQTIKQTGFVSGIEGGYNWRSGNLLLGVETDLEAVHLIGSTGTGAVPYPGAPAESFTVTSYGDADWLLTARPRIGFVTPNDWLFYVTGGLALTELRSDFSFEDTVGAAESSKIDKIKAGYAVGGGVEAPLSDRLSIKADYIHIGFSNTAGVSDVNNALFLDQVFTHSSNLKADLFRAGLNYHFGGPDPAPGGLSILPFKAPPMGGADSFRHWQLETGARLWLSNGQEQEGPLFNAPPLTLSSRLTYSGLEGVSGETFARLDHDSGFFLKGYFGAGGLRNGGLNDEDFPNFDVYSNTHDSLSGHIGYATVDVGYDFLKAPGAKVGAFVGYNYYQQAINGYNCVQLAGDPGCGPGTLQNLMYISEYDHFDSLRVGLASQIMLTDRVRLSADAAYVPWTRYQGLDDHLTGQTLFPDASNSGSGVMLEAILDYYLTHAWSVGIGGRYWAWNLNMGISPFDYLTTPAANVVEPSRYSAERYGVFAQTSYHWGEPTPAAKASAMPLAMGPMNWTGWYVGGHLGGGVSDARWSDPFGSTAGAGGFINVAGFGDKTHATGPLGGAQVGANWQTGPWVLGTEVDASMANMRGENTCFSGLGGINCQHIVSVLGSVTGRVGYAWDRSLAYVKAGGAWTDTAYNLFGNTFALTLGGGGTSMTTWGWTAGIGVEYAVTNHWTAFAEYDHVGLPSTTVPFPMVAVVNTQNIAVSQSADLFKMGVNYKFDFGPWPSLGS